jgi:hypothetical protein
MNEPWICYAVGDHEGPQGRVHRGGLWYAMAYDDPVKATFLQPLFENLSRPVIWRCEGLGLETKGPVRLMFDSLRPLRRHDVPPEPGHPARVRFARDIARRIHDEPNFVCWDAHVSAPRDPDADPGWKKVVEESARVAMREIMEGFNRAGSWQPALECAFWTIISSQVAASAGRWTTARAVERALQVASVDFSALTVGAG